MKKAGSQRAQRHFFPLSDRYRRDMQYAYAQCMDGHYYLPIGGPCCPVDGSTSVAAEEILALGVSSGGLSLGSLMEAGASDAAINGTFIVELPDSAPAPALLRPWFDGDREPR